MTFEINMGTDGILRVKLSGDIDNGLAKNISREYTPYLEAATPDKPLLNLYFMKNLGRMSSSIRKYLLELSNDPRYGYSAFVQPSRRAKILGKFILKATGRDNIHFFEGEKEALLWLKTYDR